jgi:hypothetical protein
MGKRFLISILLLINLYSCKNQSDFSHQPTENLNNTIIYAVDPIEETTSFDWEKIQFPRLGNDSKDFNPNPKEIEIQYESEGDLNLDGLYDIVLVLKRIGVYDDVRPTLILIQSPENSFQLKNLSFTAMPIEYSDEYKIYDFEDLSIDDGQLIIDLNSIGPAGKNSSTYRYLEDELILTEIETYNMGAGSHMALDYDILKGEITQTIINTMEEDMPSEEKTFSLGAQKFRFENADPIDIIIQSYQKFESDW